MRVSVYLLCATLVVAVRATGDDSDDTGAGFFGPRRIQPQDNGQEHDTLSYFLPRLTPKYRPSTRWNENADSEYVINEIDDNNVIEQEPVESEERFKRAGPSLSIVNPLDVLRQRLLLEMARRQMRESSRQVMENRKLMKAIGKRGPFLRQIESHHRSNPVGYDTM